MIALVIDDKLMLALPVASEIKDRAMISGGLTEDEVNKIYTLLTATEMKDAVKP